jgi:hypothetical protein
MRLKISEIIQINDLQELDNDKQNAVHGGEGESQCTATVTCYKDGTCKVIKVECQ